MIDLEYLIDEILKRVTQKIHELQKSKILVIQNIDILPIYLSEGQCVSIDKIETQDSLHLLDECDTIVIHEFTCEQMSQLVEGICGNEYVRFLQKALLQGKKLYIPTEEVELHKYKETAPYAYYQKLENKLQCLIDSGVVICSKDQLSSKLDKGIIIENTTSTNLSSTLIKEKDSDISSVTSITLEKRILTERDLIELPKKVSELVIGKRTILTDLAKDHAKNRKISIIRK